MDIIYALGKKKKKLVIVRETILSASPNNLVTVPENLHVNAAGSVGVSDNVDFAEFSLWI